MIKIAKNRSLRTVFLAVFAALAFTASAIFSFDIEPRVMLHFFIVSVMGLGILIFLALCFTGIKVLIKHYLKR